MLLTSSLSDQYVILKVSILVQAALFYRPKRQRKRTTEGSHIVLPLNRNKSCGWHGSKVHVYLWTQGLWKVKKSTTMTCRA